MYRNFRSLIKLFSPILVLITSCVLDIENPIEESLSIEWISIDYDQVENKLFLQLEILPENKIINDVFVEISSDNFDTTILLNDNGEFGDLIPQNYKYSSLSEIYLTFDDYQFKAVIDGFELEEVNFSIEEQFPPVVEEIIFIKSYENNKYEFSNNNYPYYVNENDTTYLNFEIKIKDLNGIDNIQSVRYKTLTHWDTAEGDCGCIQGETCAISSPTFYLNNINSTSSDSIFTYVAINDYIKEPGFPINPLAVCNRSGVITFSFVVFDLYFGPQTFVEDLLFSPCSELNCENDCGGCGE